MAGRARDEGGKAVETLKVVRKTFTMLSENHTQVLDITKQIRDIMLSADVKEGILLVNSLHTTCALFVNEFQGALIEDVKTMIQSGDREQRLPPRRSPLFRLRARQRAFPPARGPPRPQRGRGHQRGGAVPRALPVHSLRRVRWPTAAEHRRADHWGRCSGPRGFSPRLVPTPAAAVVSQPAW